jgi:hypothetical protein
MNRPTEVLKVLQGLPNHTKTHGANKWIEDERKYPEFVDFVQKTQPNSVFEIGPMLGYALVAAKYARPEITRLHWIDTERDISGSNKLCEENILSLDEEVDVQYWKKVDSNFKPTQCDLVIVDAHYHDSPAIIADFSLARALLPKWIVGWGCNDSTSCILKTLKDQNGINPFHLKDTLGMWVYCSDYEMQNSLFGNQKIDEETKSWDLADDLSNEDSSPVDAGDTEEGGEDAY